MNGLEEKFADLFVNKLPAMSASGKETTAKFLPLLMIVWGVLGLTIWLHGMMHFGAWLMWHMAGVGFLVNMIVVPVTAGMSLAGGYLMKNRLMRGWRLAFYSLLIGYVIQVFDLNLLGIAIQLVITYLLFQIRELYLSGR